MTTHRTHYQDEPIFSDQDLIRQSVMEYNERNPDKPLEWKTGGYRTSSDYDVDDALRSMEAERMGFGNALLVLAGGFSLIVILVSLIK